MEKLREGSVKWFQQCYKGSESKHRPQFVLRKTDSRLPPLTPLSYCFSLCVFWNSNGMAFYYCFIVFFSYCIVNFPHVFMYSSVASFFMILLAIPSKRACDHILKWSPIVGHVDCTTLQRLFNWEISIFIFKTLVFQLTHVPTLFEKQNRLHVARQSCWQNTPSCQIYTNPSPVYCTMS